MTFKIEAVYADKVLKRLPNGAVETSINSMANTLREATPDLRYCPHCEGWIAKRPDPMPSVFYAEYKGKGVAGKLYMCKRCAGRVAFIADQIEVPGPDQLEEAKREIGVLRLQRDILIEGLREIAGFWSDTEKYPDAYDCLPGDAREVLKKAGIDAKG